MKAKLTVTISGAQGAGKTILASTILTTLKWHPMFKGKRLYLSDGEKLPVNGSCDILLICNQFKEGE